MNEEELFKAWKQVDKNEKRVFVQHQGDYERLAQQRSNDVFRKIKNNIIGESIVGAIVFVIFPFFFLEEPIFFWIITVLMIVSAVFSIPIYTKYFKDLKQLNESSVVESIKKKRAILTRYVKQLNFYTLIFAPLGFFVGLAFALKEDEITLVRMFTITAVSLPFLGVFLWLGKRYIHQMYGKFVKNLDDIYESLTDNQI